MPKRGSFAVKTLDDFVEKVNWCGNGRYEIGIDESTKMTGTLRATVCFNRAYWMYVTESMVYDRILILSSTNAGAEQERIRIHNAQSVELLRCNELGAAYIITAGEMRQEKHLIYLDRATKDRAV